MKVSKNHIVLTPGDNIFFETVEGERNALYFDIEENKFIVQGTLSADMIQGVQSINHVEDVDITNPEDGQFLSWNESIGKWVAADVTDIPLTDSRITINDGDVPGDVHPFDMHIIARAD